MAERLAGGRRDQRRPALRLDCGTEDDLLAPNRAFHAHLDRLGIAHTYAEFPGGHDWAYWDRQVQEAVAFFGVSLGLGAGAQRGEFRRENPG